MSSDAHSSALAAGTRIRDYTIVSVIGTGGFSIVYKALDNSLMREVALKEYFPAGFAMRANDGSVRPHSRESAMFGKGIESFLNEGKLLAQFDHPALVRVYRCWEESGTAYLAMRLYTGSTLRDAVNAGNFVLTEASLKALLMPLCDTLELLHNANCYHRDVAPDNILLSDTHTPVLLDFGAARKAIEGTQVFTAILKPGYAPIEQYGDGELKQGPWTDLYALAGVVHFALTGRAPPTAISRMLKDAMLRPRDAFAGRLPTQWLDAIERALAVKPENRPQSVAEFREQFGWDEAPETLVETAPLAATPVAVTQRVDDGTIVAPSPPPAAKSAPSLVPAPELMPAPAVVNDESTVVMPRRVIDAQVAAARSLPSPEPAPKPAPKQSPQAVASKPNAATADRSRVLVWIAAATAAVALAALAWKLTTGPAAPAPAPVPTPEIKVIVPSPNPANDTSADKKSSLPSGAVPGVPQPTAAPGGVNPQTTPPATPTTSSNTVTQPSSSNAPGAANGKPKSEASRDERRREAAAKRAREAATNADDGEDRAPAGNKKQRPARCELLIERFQLGEALSESDNRFIRESCK